MQEIFTLAEQIIVIQIYFRDKNSRIGLIVLKQAEPRSNDGNQVITFWAYDDESSFIPTVYPRKELQIIDGTQLEFNKILKKLEKHSA